MYSFFKSKGVFGCSFFQSSLFSVSISGVDQKSGFIRAYVVKAIAHLSRFYNTQCYSRQLSLSGPCRNNNCSRRKQPRGKGRFVFGVNRNKAIFPVNLGFHLIQKFQFGVFQFYQFQEKSQEKGSQTSAQRVVIPKRIFRS